MYLTKQKKMAYNTSLLKRVFLIMFSLSLTLSFAQQDPQYTQYIYNTMSVNPAYAGQRDVISVTGLHRTQWVGLDGAPQTETLGIHAPLRNQRVGLGLSVVNDKLGPADEIYINLNYSYTLPLNDKGKELSFGLKGGIHNLSTDWSKGRYKNQELLFAENISRFSPTIGAGLYLHSESWYMGLSVPNILITEHYDDIQESIAAERLHFFLIAGVVFDLSKSLKLKPAALIKAVSGAPLIADISANLLFNDQLTLGLAWRWDDSVSVLAGFQITEGLFIGYSYDATTTGLSNYNSGSHEIMLRFEIQQIGKILSPRFF